MANCVALAFSGPSLARLEYLETSVPLALGSVSACNSVDVTLHVVTHCCDPESVSDITRTSGQVHTEGLHGYTAHGPVTTMGGGGNTDQS